jgi:hypothetical protein
MNILYIGYLFTNQNNTHEKNCDFNFDGFVES